MFGQIELLPGAEVANSVMAPMPTEWWLRPVSSADPVSSLYPSGFPFTGGEIKKVVFDVADDAYVDVERHLAAAMMRD